MPEGELIPGAWGEGFMDRRHPHTYAHELLVSGSDLLGGRDGAGEISVTAGKGFVPFGTDDPMSRPTVRFPVNHHLSQILERAVVLAGVRVGPALLEGALFNGDEPVSPGSWPAWDRFGDSWSARLTVTPLEGLEVQGSYARVDSPEDRGGAAPADRKVSASARWERGRWYGELEWARTATADGAFTFHSALAEGAVTLGKNRPYVRLERSDRPEEERLFSSRFRTRRPLFDNSILGITRWTVLTGGSALDMSWRTLRYTPFVEASWIGIARVGGGVFDPLVFFGRTRGVALTLGVRLATGMRMHRMGRYGGWPSEATGRMDMPMHAGSEE
jgi:hypothetical protein